MTDKMTVHVPGTAMDHLRTSVLFEDPEEYTVHLDDRPLAVNASRALHEAPTMRRGRGHTYQVTAEPETLRYLADVMRNLAERLDEKRERENRATINSLRSCAARIKGAVRIELAQG